MANEIVKYAFLGIRASVTVLILNAALKLLKKIRKNIFVITLLLASFTIAFFFSNISTVYLIMSGLVIGVIYYTIRDKVSSKEVE